MHFIADLKCPAGYVMFNFTAKMALGLEFVFYISFVGFNA